MLEKVSHLKAVSPFPVKFQLLKNGKVMDEKEDIYEYEYNIHKTTGNYLVVASIKLDNQWMPWVFTNPIYVY